MKNAEVKVLRAGDYQERDGTVYAPATISLIMAGSDNIVVDTGGIHDSGGSIKNWIEEEGLILGDITATVITHNHPDHTGNIRYFDVNPSSVIYGSDSTYSRFKPHLYNSSIHHNEELAAGVRIYKTPGHENSFDQSVLVDTDDGLVAIVGDLFLNEYEFRNPTKFLWPPNDEELALESRKNLMDLKPRKVVPGHGQPFYV